MHANGIRELVRQAQGGDLQAMERLLESIRHHLEVFARRLGDPDGTESASDIVQKAEMRVWRSLPTFRGAADDEGTRAALLSWIQKIVRNLELNATRDRHAPMRMPPEGILPLDAIGVNDSSSGRGMIEPAASELTPHASAEAEEQAGRVRQAIEGIHDATNREVVRRCFFDGLSLHQVAKSLDLGYDNVRERFHATLRMLERQLADLR